MESNVNALQLGILTISFGPCAKSLLDSCSMNSYIEQKKVKILIIRFSSFGDIIQGLFALDQLTHHLPQSEIHWAVRNDSVEFLNQHTYLKKVWGLDRNQGIKGLWQLARALNREKFTHLYDAHCNLRSHLLVWFLFIGSLLQGYVPHFIRRKKHRFKRWLLMKWKIKWLPWPFRGALSYLQPLTPWGIKNQELLPPLLKLSLQPVDRIQSQLKYPLHQYIVIAPSAAWELKRWPLEYWLKLISLLSDQQFIVVGGPQDHFCSSLSQAFPQQVLNLAGQLSWPETGTIISAAQLVISGDTGVMHLADYLNQPTLALIGPTAFGFPVRSQSLVLESSMSCRPCTKDGRGTCIQKTHQLCLVNITPQQVCQKVKEMCAKREIREGNKL